MKTKAEVPDTESRREIRRARASRGPRASRRRLGLMMQDFSESEPFLR